MNISLKTLSVILFVLCFASLVVSAQDDLKLPSDVQAFVGKGQTAVALESADLNGDGRKDYILIVENPAEKTRDDLEGPRVLLILTRQADKTLKLEKSNDKVVYCRSCGGAFGDPFAGLRLKPNSFTVDNYGGSAERWGDSYTFNYSRIDKTWQLVKVERETFNATNPSDTKTKIRTPKNFGKVDIADFDPDKIK